MARQTFSIRENRRIGREAASGIATDFLVVRPAHEIERAESRIASGKSAGGKDVITTRDVIAEHHRRFFTDEHAARIADLREQAFCIGDGQQ